ncbi:MAG TPA: ABC transporter substrate-binding protein [Stellaceae bacterium]|jgi:branched-chain amino acid transport system substrate-binding protein|nr:ABC transporter substrate-binding protein [Stellaceae bacterium]
MVSSLSRRGFLVGAGLAALPFAPAIAQSEPVRIGLLTVKTGPLAQGGIQMEQGLTLFLKDRNNALAGRKVEMISADTGGNPAGAKTKAQELVERDKVDFIVGPLAAFELLAITDYIADARMPMLSLAAADDMTQRKPNPWFIRASATSSQCNHPLGDYAAKEMKLKAAATISEDFAYGYEQCGGFQRVFEDNGGKIVLKLWPPLVTADYTPYLAQIKDVDCVWTGFAGSNPIKLMKQYDDIGLKEKYPVLGGWTAFDDALLKSFGDEAVGAVSASWYSTELDAPSNKTFIAGMQRDYQILPGGYAAGTYVNGMVIEAALEKTGGKTDKQALIDALRAVSLADTPRGAFRFDHLGNVIGNVFIRKLERKDGKLVNTIVKTYADVGQFWTYGEQKYLAAPVYTRDAAPVKL